ncbi:MAG: GNAT family N-acetyltransferase [Thermoplasmata archaeon]
MSGHRKGSRQDNYPDTIIRSVDWSLDFDIVRRLFREYRQWIADHRDPTTSGNSVGLDSIDQQITELPGAYGPPRGEVLLAFMKGVPVACEALRELEPKVGEIKRLYIRADHRGVEFGLRLISGILSRARELGYERIRVDAHSTMTAAIQFYKELGFRPIPAYWPHPTPGALFFEVNLARSKSAPRRSGASGLKRSGR